MKWFIGAGTLLAIALALDLGLMAYALYALLAAMAVSRIATWAWTEQLEATRHCSHATAQPGEIVTVSLVVRNLSRLPVGWLLMEDLLPGRALMFDPPRLAVQGRRLHLAMLKPQSQTTLLYQFRCNQRGYYQIGPAVLETGDYFGLHRRYRVAASPNFLLVYPRVIPLAGFDIASRRPIGEVRLAHRLYEDPTRIAGVRRYQAGDPLNRVNWSATARTGVLHSKVYEPSSVAGITVVLDFHSESYEPRNEPVRSELAITAAASLAHAVYQLGQQIGLATNGRDAADRIRQEGWEHDFRSRAAAQQAASQVEENTRLQPVVSPAQRGPEQFLRMLELLGRVELNDGLPFPQLLMEVDSRLRRDATVVAVLARVDAAVTIALGNLKRRGFAVTAILNIYDEYEFADAAGLLLAQQIPSLHLQDEEAVQSLCRQFVLR